jgi:hypothetical protein
MPATLCAILTAYLLGTFVLQPQRIIERGPPVWRLLLHAASVTSASYLLLGTFHWRILLAILMTVAILGAIKVHKPSDSAGSFLVNQCAHLVVLVGLAWYFPDAAKNGWWITSVKPDVTKWYFASLSCASGIILCVPAGGVLIARTDQALHSWDSRKRYRRAGTGRSIHRLAERILVMLLVLMEQPNGIGFLIAAKSILRFGEIKDASQRKVAEYIIIGTFLSFGWALLVSVLTQKAIKYWIQ